MKKHKKQDVTEQLIAIIKNKNRQRLFKLDNLKWCCGLLVFSITLLTMSYIFSRFNWLSNAFMSVGCGILTGLVLYFLSNLRNIKVESIKSEYEWLVKTNDLLHEIIGIKNHYSPLLSTWEPKYNELEDLYAIVSLLGKLEDIVKEMPHTLNRELGLSTDSLLNCNNISAFRDKLYDIEDADVAKKNIMMVSKQMISIADRLHEPLYGRKTQISYLGKYFF